MAAAKKTESSPTRNKGNVTVEFTVALSTIVLLVTGFMIFGYLSVAKVWLRHMSYESVICLAARTNPSTCRSRLETGVQAVLPIGTLRTFEFSRGPRQAIVRFEFRIARQLRFSEARRLALPIRTRSRGY